MEPLPYDERLKIKIAQIRWRKIHLDPLLLILLILLAGAGLGILYSSSSENLSLVINQSIRLGAAFLIMIIFAQIPPHRYYQWTPWVFGFGFMLIVMVSLAGHIGQGARRWLDLGLIHVQPSEVMKLAMPMMMAWILSKRILPPRFTLVLASLVIILIPTILIAKQPDLGTAILVCISGLAVLFFAGLRWRWILSLLVIMIASAPTAWHFLHQYQKERILTFINPETDPLGSGYQLIQSKIAIGSGGIFGKGWMGGTQSHLSFLPAHTTDFIFAVSSEELGFIGCCIILLIFLIVFARSLYISTQAQNTYTRLLAGSLAVTFIMSAFINICMVIGVLPVVGIPLPLISYGGSSMVTLMAGFGMIMSIKTHRKLWGN